MKNTWLRNFFIAMLTLLMVSAGSVTTYARGNACVCNNGNMAQYGSPSYSSWVLTGKTRACTHGLDGTDAQKSRTKTVNYKCTSCGRTSSTQSKQYTWVCRGYSD